MVICVQHVNYLNVFRQTVAWIIQEYVIIIDGSFLKKCTLGIDVHKYCL